MDHHYKDMAGTCPLKDFHKIHLHTFHNDHRDVLLDNPYKQNFHHFLIHKSSSNCSLSLDRRTFYSHWQFLLLHLHKIQLHIFHSCNVFRKFKNVSWNNKILVGWLGVFKKSKSLNFFKFFELILLIFKT